MVRVSSVAALLLSLAWGAAAQTPPSPASPSGGQDSPGLTSKQFPNHNGGLVTYYSSNRLTDDQSQTAINVFFDRDSAVVKRSGQQLYGNISGCTSQVRAGGNYLSPAGNAYLFEACGNYVYVSAGNGSFATIGGTISATANVYMKQGLGAEWITDGVDTLWSTNGVTVSSYPAAPLAQYIGIFQGRVVLDNVSGGVSTVYLSGYNNGSDYSLPAVLVDTSAAIFGLNGLNDGRAGTCVSDGYRDVLILWNHDEMYGLYGSGNSSFILRKLAEIGCDEQESVQEFDGKLRWLSQYGIYQYDGLNTQRISDPIKDQILNIIASEPGSLSLIQDQFTDWENGNLAASGPGAQMSDTISEDNVVPGTATFVNTSTMAFVAGTLTNISTNSVGALTLTFSSNVVLGGNFPSASGWTIPNPAFSGQTFTGSNGAVIPGVGSAVIACPNGEPTCSYANLGATNLQCSSPSYESYACFFDGVTGNVLGGPIPLSGLNQSINISSLVNVASTVAVGFEYGVAQACSSFASNTAFSIKQSPSTGSGVNLVVDSAKTCSGSGGASSYCGGSGQVCTILTISNVRISSYAPTGTYTSSAFDTTFSTPVMSAVALSFSSDSVTTLTVQQENSTNGVSWSAPSTLTNGTTALNSVRYWRYIENFATTSGTHTPVAYGAALAATTTGYFITGCFPVAPITSWGTLQSLNTSGNGTLSYAVSTGATCRSVETTTVTWTAQSINTTISVATAAYIGVRVLFNGFSSFVSTQQPTLEDITVNWNSAAGRPRTASQVFDNRYWLAFTTNTTPAAANNTVLVYDSMGHWSQFVGINASDFVVYNRVLYAGSSLSDGNILVENTGSSDAGQPILFDFRTPDYELDAFNTVDLYDLNLEFGAVSAVYSPNMAVRYYADNGSTPYSLGTVPLVLGSKGLVYGNARFGASTASPVKVHTVSFELIDDTPTPITFYRSMIRFTPEDGP